MSGPRAFLEIETFIQNASHDTFIAKKIKGKKEIELRERNGASRTTQLLD